MRMLLLTAVTLVADH